MHCIASAVSVLNVASTIALDAGAAVHGFHHWLVLLVRSMPPVIQYRYRLGSLAADLQAKPADNISFDSPRQPSSTIQSYTRQGSGFHLPVKLVKKKCQATASHQHDFLGVALGVKEGH